MASAIYQGVRPSVTAMSAAITPRARFAISAPTTSGTTGRSAWCAIPRRGGHRAHARFQGFYTCCTARFSPMEGVGPDDIRIRELMARLSTAALKK